MGVKAVLEHGGVVRALLEQCPVLAPAPLEPQGLARAPRVHVAPDARAIVAPAGKALRELLRRPCWRHGDAVVEPALGSAHVAGDRRPEWDLHSGTGCSTSPQHDGPCLRQGVALLVRDRHPASTLPRKQLVREQVD